MTKYKVRWHLLENQTKNSKNYSVWVLWKLIFWCFSNIFFFQYQQALWIAKQASGLLLNKMFNVYSAQPSSSELYCLRGLLSCSFPSIYPSCPLLTVEWVPIFSINQRHCDTSSVRAKGQSVLLRWAILSLGRHLAKTKGLPCCPHNVWVCRSRVVPGNVHFWQLSDDADATALWFSLILSLSPTPLSPFYKNKIPDLRIV